MLFRGLKALGLLWAPVHLPEYPAWARPRPPDGPPAGHPEGWSPQRPVPAEDQELWAQLDSDVR